MAQSYDIWSRMKAGRKSNKCYQWSSTRDAWKHDQQVKFHLSLFNPDPVQIVGAKIQLARAHDQENAR